MFATILLTSLLAQSAPPAPAPSVPGPTAPVPATAPARAPGAVAPPAPAAKAPASPYVDLLRIEPPVLELGTIMPGERRTGTVRLVNTSKSPVHILKLAPACGCTTTTPAPEQPLEPGASVAIEVTLSAARNASGTIRRVVNVQFEGGGIQAFQLEAKVPASAKPLPPDAPAQAEVALFRLPEAVAGDPGAQEAAERAQDEAVFAVDAALQRAGAVAGIALRLHRETGTLFVHGTPLQVKLARGALAGRLVGIPAAADEPAATP
jgi:hypothetical protein